MAEKGKIVKKGLMVIAGLLVGVQLVRPTKNIETIPSKNGIETVVSVPDNIKLILKTACYDCHSNTTVYPWYSEIMPVGLWLNHHVEEGKEHLNFSEFAAYSPKRQDHKLEEIADEVSEMEMPLSSYTLFHGEAKLTNDQIIALKAWVDEARKEINYTESN